MALAVSERPLDWGRVRAGFLLPLGVALEARARFQRPLGRLSAASPARRSSAGASRDRIRLISDPRHNSVPIINSMEIHYFANISECFFCSVHPHLIHERV